MRFGSQRILGTSEAKSNGQNARMLSMLRHHSVLPRICKWISNLSTQKCVTQSPRYFEQLTKFLCKLSTKFNLPHQMSILHPYKEHGSND